ncbi:epoxide hydrolase N-terminal domain-containing protein [Nitrospirillum amazonense]|uniref:epoxide hydrolase N-terminal domain-containing protein n=1 Tax=Nitrospirillum amazonense TaxID=28077 RepID=UPI001B3B5810|nr:epoxide hydrolase N-terminal domain-containing protein [Nitrospirillum amazonense]
MFITEIDGLDIHFIHVRSRHLEALPMIMTHGWPGSILEFLKVATSRHWPLRRQWRAVHHARAVARQGRRPAGLARPRPG